MLKISGMRGSALPDERVTGSIGCLQGSGSGRYHAYLVLHYSTIYSFSPIGLQQNLKAPEMRFKYQYL